MARAGYGERFFYVHGAHVSERRATNNAVGAGRAPVHVDARPSLAAALGSRKRYQVRNYCTTYKG